MGIWADEWSGHGQGAGLAVDVSRKVSVRLGRLQAGHLSCAMTRAPKSPSRSGDRKRELVCLDRLGVPRRLDFEPQSRVNEQNGILRTWIHQEITCMWKQV